MSGSLTPVQKNVLIPLVSLFPHDRNYRGHPPDQVKMLKASLERFHGQVRSIVVQECANGSYTIVAGHGVVQAAQELVDANPSHYSHLQKLRCDIIDISWPADEVNAYLIADNNLSQHASDDSELLAQLLQEQQNAGYDLASLGTDDETLRQMLEALGDEYVGGGQEEGDGGDEFDATPQEGPTRTHVGEIWQLGPHKLLVGDCTDVRNVQCLMADERADCCWTDPPYGVSYVGKTKDALTIQNDGKEDIDAFLKRAFVAIDTALEDGAAIYIAHPAGALCVTFGNRFIAQGWRFHQTLIWVKDSMVLGHSDYHFQHEPIYFGYKPGQGRYGRGGKGWYGDDSQKSVFDIPRPKRSEEHPTTKPVELVETMLVNSAPAKGIVNDPFGGSGTTLIAAHRLRMRCNTVELDPRYADVILARYEAESGEKAELLERVEEVAHA